MGPDEASISGKDAARYAFYKVIYTFEMSLFSPRCRYPFTVSPFVDFGFRLFLHARSLLIFMHKT